MHSTERHGTNAHAQNIRLSCREKRGSIGVRAPFKKAAEINGISVTPTRAMIYKDNDVKLQGPRRDEVSLTTCLRWSAHQSAEGLQPEPAAFQEAFEECHTDQRHLGDWLRDWAVHLDLGLALGRTRGSECQRGRLLLDWLVQDIPSRQTHCAAASERPRGSRSAAADTLALSGLSAAPDSAAPLLRSRCSASNR